ncbi:hypothetical protein [Desulfoluna spongiiphila]|uniref:Uncharacterized protein n=1 Tax=Desulfoluna spongiiphila TaxID=419481 RepID=A0A1G5G0Y8_9BACT|nr:hypothetical protein [Desulfoluna spongiiphila]SCY45029.1 hypothetical protein SAMN05216233_109126 [Desulfoluna spongiiphila]
MRARNIKPGFFCNEELAECSFPARILFAGLWCLADREGYLEDRPKKIKIQIFPADSVDCEALLCELSAAKLIARYSGDDGKYIWIPSFRSHQNPHRREKPSKIPPHPEDAEKRTEPEGENTEQGPSTDSPGHDQGQAKDGPGYDQGQAKDGPGYDQGQTKDGPGSGQGQAKGSPEHDQGQARGEPRPNRARLNPDTGILNPESGFKKDTGNSSESPADPLETFSVEIVEFVKGFDSHILAKYGKSAPKATASHVLKSCDAVDRLIRTDGFTLEEIKQSVWWACRDDFWGPNAKSLAALRKKGEDGTTKFQKIYTASRAGPRTSGAPRGSMFDTLVNEACDELEEGYEATRGSCGNKDGV